ncbi:MAG: zf-HC2 domain-containing protein [Lachnospiraceae bacterium]|nr:zf-HC2 domain-containing protein [Lachnospiraceae bacterium]
MNELNCNVVKDLLPSYMDGLCSEDSRRLVEQHLQTCPDCRSFVEMLRESEVAERQKESGQIAYMRKIKRHVNARLFGWCALLVIFGVGLWMHWDNYGVMGDYYLAALPLLLADVHFLLSDYAKCRERTGSKTILTAGSSLLVCCSLLLGFLSIQWGQKGGWPVESEAELGPFVRNWHLLLVLCQLAILAAGIVLTVRTSNSHSILISISAAGIALSLYMISSLGTLVSVEYLAKSMRGSWILLLEGACIACAMFFLEKRRLRAQQH